MAKKKKVRVALRKNRQKRTRSNDLTRQFRHDEPGAGRRRRTDRVRPRGELSRHRTIIEEVGAAVDRDVGGVISGRRGHRVPWTRRRACKGRVLRVHGLVLMVRADDGRTYPCHVRGLLRNLAIEGRNIVTVGDRVWFRPAGSAGAEGMIERIESRHGVITRGYRNRQQVIAANVDQVLIVSALAEPGLKARPGRPLSRLGRDRRRPPGGRLQQGRPRRHGDLPVGRSASTPSSATRPW